MGKLKVVSEDREGRKREYIMEYSNEGEKLKKHKRIFEDWIKQKPTLDSYKVTVTSA